MCSVCCVVKLKSECVIRVKKKKDHIYALNDFKQEMIEYYKTALSNYYCENPRTFKSVCFKCNKCRSLAQPVSCCF